MSHKEQWIFELLAKHQAAQTSKKNVMKVKFKIKNEKDRLREFVKEFKSIEHLNKYRETLIKTNCFIFKETYLP